ncbi:MAG: SHOCT domain-containing protein [Acidimicrobiia bacterium]|nr:SHOCT domain-containing protein [Acidimicrobiia bacterium]
MPGLLRGVARTAVIAGTASAVSGRVQRRQAEKFADRDAQIYADRQQADQQQVAAQAPPPAAAPAAAPAASMTDELARLADMKAQGLLTDEEFAAAKAQLLGG